MVQYDVIRVVAQAHTCNDGTSHAPRQCRLYTNNEQHYEATTTWDSNKNINLRPPDESRENGRRKDHDRK